MYILCDSSNNKNACDKVILHAEKEENFVHKTGGHFIMAKNMDGTNKSENSYGQLWEQQWTEQEWSEQICQ